MCTHREPGVAENPVERSISNGPLRAWSKDFSLYELEILVFHDVCIR